jgi:hypothetical protein
MIISGRFFDHFCNHGQNNPWKFEVSANVHQGSSKCCDIPSEAYEQVRQTFFFEPGQANFTAQEML